MPTKPAVSRVPQSSLFDQLYKAASEGFKSAFPLTRRPEGVGEAAMNASEAMGRQNYILPTPFGIGMARPDLAPPSMDDVDSAAPRVAQFVGRSRGGKRQPVDPEVTNNLAYRALMGDELEVARQIYTPGKKLKNRHGESYTVLRFETRADSPERWREGETVEWRGVIRDDETGQVLYDTAIDSTVFDSEWEKLRHKIAPDEWLDRTRQNMDTPDLQRWWENWERQTPYPTFADVEEGEKMAYQYERGMRRQREESPRPIDVYNQHMETLEELDPKVASDYRMAVRYDLKGQRPEDALATDAAGKDWSESPWEYEDTIRKLEQLYQNFRFRWEQDLGDMAVDTAAGMPNRSTDIPKLGREPENPELRKALGLDLIEELPSS